MEVARRTVALRSEPPGGPVAQPGQSGRLIIGWSLVRSQPGPPPLLFFQIRIGMERIRLIGSSFISRFTCIYRLVLWRGFVYNPLQGGRAQPARRRLPRLRARPRPLTKDTS